MQIYNCVNTDVVGVNYGSQAPQWLHHLRLFSCSFLSACFLPWQGCVGSTQGFEQRDFKPSGFWLDCTEERPVEKCRGNNAWSRLYPLTSGRRSWERGDLSSTLLSLVLLGLLGLKTVTEKGSKGSASHISVVPLLLSIAL